MNRLYGFHTSIRGGLHHAPREAKELGCTTFQMFLGSPRSWTLRIRSEEEIAVFRETLKELGFDFFVVHCSYLLNPLSSRADVRLKTEKLMREELDLAARISADYYVVHLRDNRLMELANSSASLKNFSAGWNLKQAFSLRTQRQEGFQPELKTC